VFRPDVWRFGYASATPRGGVAFRATCRDSFIARGQTKGQFGSMTRGSAACTLGGSGGCAWSAASCRVFARYVHCLSIVCRQLQALGSEVSRPGSPLAKEWCSQSSRGAEVAALCGYSSPPQLLVFNGLCAGPIGRYRLPHQSRDLRSAVHGGGRGHDDDSPPIPTASCSRIWLTWSALPHSGAAAMTLMRASCT